MTQKGSLIISAVDTAVKRVRTRALDVSFNELFDMHLTGELKIDPEYQRLFRWSLDKQSQFIESLVLELPIPPIYVIEIGVGIYELIDGLQRISSYLHFRGILPETDSGDGDADTLDSATALVLQGCDVLPELNGFTYEELPMALQIKLKRHFIRMEVLRKETDRKLRYHMFKRLNTGGELLSPQEIRNCTIRLLDNRFNDFLKEMTQDTAFRNSMQRLSSSKVEQMYLEELVLRFFALKNNRDEYTKDIGDFLTDYMEKVADLSSGNSFDYDCEELTFKNTFKLLNDALGEGAFSGFNEKGNPQGYFSTLHFETFSLGIQPHLNELIGLDEDGKDKLKKVLIEIKTDDEFQDLTKGGGKNYSAHLERRINFVSGRVGECLL